MLDLILAAFAVSGAAGLVYETVWLKQLEQILGTTAYASGTVLAVFMGGLALGSAWGARYAAKRLNPRRDYAALEFSVALWALFQPLIFNFLDSAYLSVAANASVGSTLFIRVILSAFYLGPSAFLMGASFPFLLRSLGGRALSVYTLNTLGALAGAAAAGFLLLPWLGLRHSTLVAAGLNIVAALLALASKGRGIDEAGLKTEAPSRLILPAHLWMSALLSGVSAMFLEIAIVRALVMVVGPSVYAFSAMLTAFLAGILLASHLASKSVTRKHVTVALTVAGLSGVFLSLILPKLPFGILGLYGALQSFGLKGKGVIAASGALLSFLAIIPAATLVSSALPLALGEAETSGADSRQLGLLYSLNSAACVAGALLASFLLLPRLGIQATLLLGSGLFFSAVLLRLASHYERMRAACLALSLMAAPGYTALVPAWDVRALGAGAYFSMRFDPGEKTLRQRFQDRLDASELLFYKEGVLCTVTVERLKGSGTLMMANNGKIEASDGLDMKSQILVGQIPVLCREAEMPGAALERVALVGLASGVTAGSMTTHAFRQFDIFEIEPAIRRASAWFAHVNLSPLSDPRTRFIADDARDQLRLHPETYDVIVSEPSNPWVAGVSSLFTVESFTAERRALKEGGVLGQWIQFYELSQNDLRLIIRTFQNVFPKALLFQFPSTSDSGYFTSDLMLLGCKGEWKLDAGALAKAMQTERVRADLKRSGIVDPSQLLVLMRLDAAGIGSLAGQGPLHTDDNSSLEYSAPLTLGTNLDTEALVNEFYRLQGNPFEAFSLDGLSAEAKKAWFGKLSSEYRHKSLPAPAERFAKLAGKSF